MPPAAPSPITSDLPCIRCRYNLRTLSPDSLCPECASPVSQSIAEYRRARPNPRLARRAAWLLAFFFAQWPLQWIVQQCLNAFIHGAWPLTIRFPLSTWMRVAPLINLAGLFILDSASPNPILVKKGSRAFTPFGIVFALPAVLYACAVYFSLFQLAMNSLGFPIIPPAQFLNLAYHYLPDTLSLVTQLLTWRCAASIARRLAWPVFARLAVTLLFLHLADDLISFTFNFAMRTPLWERYPILDAIFSRYVGIETPASLTLSLLSIVFFLCFAAALAPISSPEDQAAR